ncbi:MAG: response regulator [Planctomycetota bacterium]|nr:response regulator [Planctomycetota bacterium]
METKTQTTQSVLLIDDDLLHGALIRAVLETAGISVFTACSEQEACDVLRTTIPDALLVGWDAEGIDGRAVLTRLKARMPLLRGVPAVLMTDRDLCDRARRELLQAGHEWVLQKPVVVTSLPKLVAHAVAEARSRARESRYVRQSRVHFIDCGSTASDCFMEAVR